MKKLTGNLTAKTAAVVLSYVCIVILAVTAIFTGILGYYKFYFSNEKTVREEILTDMAADEAQYAIHLLEKGAKLSSYYQDKNVYYRVTDYKSGEIIDTNYNGEAYLVESTATDYILNSYLVEEKYGESYYETEEIPYQLIDIYIAENMTKNDRFSVVSKIVGWGFKLQYAIIFIMLGALIGLITLLCFLYSAAGHRPNGKIRLNLLDRIPFDIYSAVIAVAAVISAVLFIDFADSSLISLIILFFIFTIDYFLALGYTMTFATRLKTRTLIKNTIIYKVLNFLWKYVKRFFGWIKYLFSNLSLVYKFVVVLGIFTVIALIFLIIFTDSMRYYYRPEIIVAMMFIALAVIWLGGIYLAITLQKIKQGGERIAGGDLEYKISTDYMYGDFKDFCESLNNINLGLQSAVNERMKSEHFKTELITNVSHDIKTPLTSIINYVDLIKKEKIENETVEQYIEVLDRQSGRLKKLVEDLVEASKASTGNIAVNLSPCDVGVLLSQTIGEFEEKLTRVGLTPVLRLPEKSVKIMADGRHLWRVFDNLMNNVAKYAMSGTRVYIDLTRDSDKAVITFRNISKYELNVSADELMERFVRGDSSRNTEGSGLGLSIARSLAELQGGELELNVDGDLFKVSVIFDVITN